MSNISGVSWVPQKNIKMCRCVKINNNKKIIKSEKMGPQKNNKMLKNVKKKKIRKKIKKN
jgi:hypothetical protein